MRRVICFGARIIDQGERTDFVKEIATGRKLEEHVNRWDIRRIYSRFHNDRGQKLEDVGVLKGGVHAHFLVECLTLRLGGFGCQRDNLACGNSMVLGINSLKHSDGEL